MTGKQQENPELPPETPEKPGFFVEFFPDFAAISGFFLVGYGCYHVYEPLGFIVSGALLLTLGVKGAQK